jgi:hypothetical protein
MDITPYVASLRDELANAAELGGKDARELAGRLVTPLESAFRLALLEALSAAANEITRDLAPGSVELRLRGREPDFVVTLPVPDAAEQPGREPAPSTAAAPMAFDGDDSAMSRVNLRLPDALKSRIEQAAGRDGLSVNAWLVRAATAAVQATDTSGPAARAPRGGQRFTGWVH